MLRPFLIILLCGAFPLLGGAFPLLGGAFPLLGGAFPLLGGAFPMLAAQQPLSVSGRVLRGGRDTIPLAKAMVVLHHVSRDNAGPIDSINSDSRGRYRFELRQPDSAGAYIVTVWFDSIAYV